MTSEMTYNSPAAVDPAPVLQPGYVAVTVGDQVTVTTTRPVVLGQNLGGLENALELPSAANFTLFADQVTIQGPMSAPGWNILIIARSISAAPDKDGKRASISVDGNPGKDQETSTLPKASSGNKNPGKVDQGLTGVAGDPGHDGEDAKSGGAGQDAGSIRIYCQRAEKPLDLVLSAAGGKGGSPQHGQDGGDGGPGGEGGVIYWNFPDAPDNAMPGRGGDGGRGGRGGAGAAGAAGGNGGTIVFAVAETDSPFSSIDASSVQGGAFGGHARPGMSGHPGVGGAGAKGQGDPQNYGYVPDAPSGADGQTDGHLQPHDALFQANSAEFTNKDIGNILYIPGLDMFSITGFVDSITINTPGDVAWSTSEGSPWCLFTVKPWGWQDVPLVGEHHALSHGVGEADGTKVLKVTSMGGLKNIVPGSLLVIPERGMYEITEVPDSGSIILNDTVKAESSLWFWVLTSPGESPGKDGSVTVIRASTTTTYQAGNPIVTTTPDSTSFTGAASYVSVDYLLMQADRARFVYLSIDPALLARMASQTINPDDPDVKAAENVVGEINNRLEWIKALIDYRKPADDEEAALTNLFVALWNTVDTMQTWLQQGLDAFGHSPNWAPPLRYEHYRTLLGGNSEAGIPSAIDALVQAEEQDVAHRQTAISLWQQQDDLSSLTSYATGDLNRLKDEADQAYASLLLLTSALDEQDQAESDALNTLYTAISDWSGEVSDALKNACGLTAAEFFDAVTQIAFLPENPLGSGLGIAKTFGLIGGAVGKLGAESAEEPTITDNNGQKVPIKYELNGLHTFDETLDTLKTGMTSLPKGTLQPNVTSDMLVGPQQALTALYDEFSNDVSDKDKAKAAKADMDAYVAAVNKRNTTILQYNETLLTLRKAQQGIQAATNLHDRAQNQKATANAMGLAEHLIDHAVDRARDWCIEVLYKMSRAYMAFALETDDELYSALNLAQAWTFDSEKAKDANLHIVQDWSSKYESYSANPNPGFKNPETQEENLEQDGVKWDISKVDFPKVFDSLLATGQATIQLPPSHKDAPTGGFNRDDANIHLRVVRCWLHNATSTTGLISLKLIHHGDDIFVNEDDMEVPIIHDPTPIAFRYLATNPNDVGTYRAVKNTQPNGVVPVDGLVRNGSNDFFEIGPFATWEIHVIDYVTPEDTKNTGNTSPVDLSKVDCITFEFFYFFQEFAGT